MTYRKSFQEIVSHRRKIQWCILDIEFEMFQIHLFSNCNHLELKLKWVILVTHFQLLWLIVYDSILWLIDMSNTVRIISIRLAPFHLRTYLLALSFAFCFQKFICSTSRLKSIMIHHLWLINSASQTNLMNGIEWQILTFWLVKIGLKSSVTNGYIIGWVITRSWWF